MPLLTTHIRDVIPATPRAHIVRVALGDQPFPYLAGQALLIASRGVEPRRPYSITNAPEEAVRDGYVELLVGVDAAGQAGPHLALTSGAPVDIDGPIGRFTFPEQPETRRFLFIAGGTGIAPLRAMLHHALNVPHEAIGVMFSARTFAEFAYESELRSLADAGQIELQLRVTRESTAPESWSGRRGRLVVQDLAPLVHDRATLCFVCGPPALVEEIPRALEELGVPKVCVRTEEWT